MNQRAMNKMKRGRFLLGAVSGLTVAANADSLFARALAQQPLAGAGAGAAGRILVVLNMQGGIDGLNTIVPHGLEAYYRYRPTLAVSRGEALRIDDTIAFNPAMRSLKDMYDAGKVAIVQGAGYPKPDHSHFRSTQIWQTAAPETFESTGWVGRYLDRSGVSKKDLFSGVAIAQVLPELMVGNATDVPASSDVHGYGLYSDKRADSRGTLSSLVFDQRAGLTSPYLQRVAEIEAHAQLGSEELPRLVSGYKTTASYPATALGRSLALAAQIAGSNLGTRVIYVQHGSFDTHVSQRGTHERLLREMSDALKAFYDDLAAHGLDGSVLTMTFSEFGRRVAENASHGTDHGEAGPMLLIGGGVKGGVYGEHPSLDRLDAGDAVYTTDFRSVYTTVLERWLARPAQGIIAGSYPTLPLLG